MKADEPEIDPFTHFGIDSDVRPPPPNLNQLFSQREVPQGTFDVFVPTPLDQRESAGHFRGQKVGHSSELSARLSSLGTWLWKVSNQPAAVWWAAGQSGLHPAVLADLQFAIDHRDLGYSSVLRSAWRYVIEGWSHAPASDHQAFTLSAALRTEGWLKPLIRRFAEIQRCALRISRPYWAGVLPPMTHKQLILRHLVNVEIQYPERHVSFAIPDDQLTTIVPLLRRNLEYAIDLNRELSPLLRVNIVPIIPDPMIAGNSSERDFGINAPILEYVALFQRLRLLSKPAALAEWAEWRHGDDPVFERLRIWAAGLGDFLDDAEAGAQLSENSDAVFWGWRDQRDVLLALKARWATMASNRKSALEILNPRRSSAHAGRQWHTE